MRIALLACLALSFLPIVAPATASEEEFLPVSEVRLVFNEREQTGRVVFAAKTDEGKFQEVQIEAFGKKYTLEKADLTKLDGYPLDMLAVTHEAGYERLGGHTIYFKFKMDPKGAPSKAMIAVSKGKGIVLSGFGRLTE